jgi:hypothetical protein
MITINLVLNLDEAGFSIFGQSCGHVVEFSTESQILLPQS